MLQEIGRRSPTQSSNSAGCALVVCKSDRVRIDHSRQRSRLVCGIDDYNHGRRADDEAGRHLYATPAPTARARPTALRRGAAIEVRQAAKAGSSLDASLPAHPTTPGSTSRFQMGRDVPDGAPGPAGAGSRGGDRPTGHQRGHLPRPMALVCAVRLFLARQELPRRRDERRRVAHGPGLSKKMSWSALSSPPVVRPSWST